MRVHPWRRDRAANAMTARGWADGVRLASRLSLFLNEIGRHTARTRVGKQCIHVPKSLLHASKHCKHATKHCMHASKRRMRETEHCINASKRRMHAAEHCMNASK